MKTLTLNIKNNIATINLNRPEVRNAFDDLMIAEMTQTFTGLSKEPELRLVVLSGEGESFCAGGDLNWMKSMVSYTEQENVEDSNKLYDMYQALCDVPVPVVAKVHGHAMGGGLGLMACCDMVAVVDGTKMSFSEVRLGLAPAVISSFVAKKVPASFLSRYFLTAEVFENNEAKEMGLAHFSGSSSECDEWLKNITKKVTNNGPKAVRATKKLLKDLVNSDDVKALTVKLIASLRVSDEGQEGLKAFFDKRNPNWLESSQ